MQNFVLAIIIGFFLVLPRETCPGKSQEKQAGMTLSRCFDAAGKSMPNPRQTSVRNVRQDPASRRKNQSVQAMPLHLLLLTRVPETGLEGAQAQAVPPDVGCSKNFL